MDADEGAVVTGREGETTAGLLKSREDWLRVVAIPAPHGGFDIALVIDGSYDFLLNDPRPLQASWLRRVKAALAADGLPVGVPLADCPGAAAMHGADVETSGAGLVLLGDILRGAVVDSPGSPTDGYADDSASEPTTATGPSGVNLALTLEHLSEEA